MLIAHGDQLRITFVIILNQATEKKHYFDSYEASELEQVF